MASKRIRDKASKTKSRRTKPRKTIARKPKSKKRQNVENDKLLYVSPLTSRYARGSPLLTMLSETTKTQTWRQLWIWLAEAEKELGLKQVTDEAIEEMKKNRDSIDWQTIRDEERRLKHDVMAHNHSFGKRMATCLYRIAKFAEKHANTVTVGRTHYQTATPVTVGKRAMIWAQDLVMVFEPLREFRDRMRFRGAKGATGTQDSFLTLFDGDKAKVQKLDELVTKKAGFANCFGITGQNYTRLQDFFLLAPLAAFGAAASKTCHDIRMLQAFGELLEPFEEHQIGSSAMPYKKNPMKSERVCSLSRRLRSAVNEALETFASQGFERTLDDSASRRIVIPESFLTTEAILRILQNIFEGLSVQEENVARIVHDELPFLAMEQVLMWLTESGVNRQQAHAKIREVTLNAKERQKTNRVNIHDIIKDPFFDPVRDRVVAIASNPIEFTGLCEEQVHGYLENTLYPTIDAYLDKNAGTVSLDV
uniref:ADSL_C domain-containing protein n=2 Tax=Steinernema glaseri TaxID=37863 RepID=A0A1I7Y1A3_9BILA